MKNLKASFLSVLTSMLFILVGCGDKAATQHNSDKSTNPDDVKMEQPAELGMSQDSLDMQVQQSSLAAAEVNKSALIEEAVQALEMAQAALEAVEDGDKAGALSALEEATGKLEILLARDPELALVPLDVSFKTHDLVADLKTIRDIKKAARQAIKDDHFQVVRDEIANLSSEIEINTSMLPLETFPTAMKIAARLIDEGNMEAAQLALYEAMDAIIIERRRIPLPIIRAEVMIGQALKKDTGDEDKKSEVLQLLENAKYQLRIAEELGYGNHDAEYAELNDAIMTLKKSVEDDGDSQGMFGPLKSKLSKFKNRITE